MHVPHVIDTEVASALRRRAAAGQISEQAAWRALGTWTRVAVTRHAAAPLIGRVWALRNDVTSYDATYVALAEQLGCPLVTADARLARAPGLRCVLTVIPR